MSAQLREASTGTVFDLADFTLIGRSEGVTIRLSDAGVSRHHASIRRDGDHYWLVDLGSANGSFVNEVALTSARALTPGDRIRFADSVLIFTRPPADLAEAPLNANTTISRFARAPFASETMTMFVADLKGFNQISQFLSAEQVAELLHEWYADCRGILRECGASIDKFIGDCVFAYWHGADGAVRLKALQAAQALRAATAEHSSPTRRLLGERHALTLDCRIGIHIGDVAVGSLGSGITTALGDAVNVTFSIEALTRVVQRPVLVSSAFLDGWDDGRPLFERCGAYPIKGHSDVIDVFAPL